jgi:hypothetical protein
MWDIVRGLAERGMTIFLTTQYLEEADELASRVAVIDRGSIIADGTPTELKRRVGSGHIVLELPTLDALAAAARMLPTARGKRWSQPSRPGRDQAAGRSRLGCRLGWSMRLRLGSGMPAPSGQIPPPWAWWENEAPTTRAARRPVPGDQTDQNREAPATEPH